jgi:predicted nucleotidyltransferase
LATLRLRDRDAIVTKEGLIFRVFGYSHPLDAYVCDVEYAPATIYRSDNPKAFRNEGGHVFYKFYEDEGWKFIQERFPQYMIFHKILGKEVVGVNRRDILRIRRPETKLKRLIDTESRNELVEAIRSVVQLVAQCSGLSHKDFGVFGSLLHGFYHPAFSDIDLIIYSKKNVARLRETLSELYQAGSSPLRNEFGDEQSIKGKIWRFQNFSPEEYLWHQRRKVIYGVFDDQKSGRTIKTEFEPVKDWREIRSEYDRQAKILQRGWARILAKVTEDDEAPFIPAIYGVEPQDVVEGSREAVNVKRVVSYVEEFRMQATKGETVDIEGNLEEVTTRKGSFCQIALTYCPRYYEQVMKVRN